MNTLMISVSHYRKLDENMRQDRSLDWQHFTLMMESEFNQFLIMDVSSQEIKLCLKEDHDEESSVILRNQKIYRRPGHHPYLFQVKSWHLSPQKPFITISVELTNGQIFSHTFHSNYIRTEDFDEK
ncbi:ComGF family competence protein [Facklamia sp. 7083-14-GEN3]|nr:ComGF family competence protein [Facklamia sp. 7083-14-GEN3]MCR8969336.1 ComGF family competence protein [Facklamia sp. 7083-14-GEN3]